LEDFGKIYFGQNFAFWDHNCTKYRKYQGVRVQNQRIPELIEQMSNSKSVRSRRSESRKQEQQKKRPVDYN
jgi:hypothetical protein